MRLSKYQKYFPTDDIYLSGGLVVLVGLQSDELHRHLDRPLRVVGVEAVDLVQHVSKELVAALQNTESVQWLPFTGEHVVEHVASQLLYPVLDHPVGDQDAADRVCVVVGDTEQVGVVA